MLGKESSKRNDVDVKVNLEVLFRDNRVYYSPCEILNNVGENKMNLSGVLITGNQLEGSTTYIEGYVRNRKITLTANLPKET